MLEEQGSGLCDLPKSGFSIEAFYEPRGAEVPRGMNMKAGYFIEGDIGELDNELFGIQNPEATYLDA